MHSAPGRELLPSKHSIFAELMVTIVKNPIIASLLEAWWSSRLPETDEWTVCVNLAQLMVYVCRSIPHHKLVHLLRKKSTCLDITCEYDIRVVHKCEPHVKESIKPKLSSTVSPLSHPFLCRYCT